MVTVCLLQPVLLLHLEQVALETSLLTWMFISRSLCGAQHFVLQNKGRRQGKVASLWRVSKQRIKLYKRPYKLSIHSIWQSRLLPMKPHASLNQLVQGATLPCLPPDFRLTQLTTSQNQGRKSWKLNWPPCPKVISNRQMHWPLL